MDIRRLIEPKVNPQIPELLPGDTVKVSLKTVEGDKERTQHFQGLVLRIKRGVDGGSFTVRKVLYGIGVERTFPSQSPLVRNVEIVRRGKVRRSKLYYMRKLSTKQTRLKERPLRVNKQAVTTEEETETE